MATYAMTSGTINYVSASQTIDPYASAFYNSLSSGSAANLIRPDYPTLWVPFTGSNIFSTYTGQLQSLSGSSFLTYITASTIIRPRYRSELSTSYYTPNTLGYQYIMMTGSFGAAGSGSVIIIGTTVTYKMRGYRTATSAYEYWNTTDPNAPPPSGNPLIDITIEQILR